jgi:RNase P protein component
MVAHPVFTCARKAGFLLNQRNKKLACPLIHRTIPKSAVRRAAIRNTLKQRYKSGYKAFVDVFKADPPFVPLVIVFWNLFAFCSLYFVIFTIHRQNR